jgi:hypothetical protein
METSTPRRIAAGPPRRTPAALHLAQCFTRLRTLLWSKDFRDLRLEFDAGRQLLCCRGRDRPFQVIDLLLVWCIRKDRHLELPFEVAYLSPRVIRLSAALFRQRSDLLALGVRQIQFTQQSHWRARRHAASRPASAPALRRLRYHRNHHRCGQDNRRDAEPYCSFHVEPPLHPY